MADSDYIIDILLRATDQASPKVAALKAEIDKLKGTQDADNALGDLTQGTKDLGTEAERTEKKEKSLREEHGKSGRAAQEAARDFRSSARDIDEHGKATSSTAGAHRDLADSISNTTKAHQSFVSGQNDVTRAIEESKKKFKESGDESDKLSQRIKQVTSDYNDFDNRVRNGSLSKTEVKRGYQDFARDLNSISRGFSSGSAEAERFGVMADKAGKKAKEAGVQATGGFLGNLKRGDVGGFLEYIDSKFDDVGIRISGVSSFLRGFMDIAKFAFAQPLITGLTSIAGSLVSVASAAAQAGAALGGAFISGVAQVVPMVSIAAAAMLRMKAIFQAVSLNNEAEKQSFFEPHAGEIKQLQNQSQLISSQQQLVNSNIQLFDAQQRVKDSQIALTESRVDAIRNITDLELAEKSAKLAAEGATISLAEARRQVQIAVEHGDTGGLASAELQVKNAELAKKKAEIEIPRSEYNARVARERGVSGAPTVISAVEGATAAKQAVTQAKQAAEAARRQMDIVEKELSEPASKETSSEAQLKFLYGQMSAPEKMLTKVLTSMDKELRSPNSPLKKITDYFVTPFTDAAERLQGLLHDNKFIGTIDGLAKAMGDSLKKYGSFVFGTGGTNFFETMANDARENLPVVTKAIIGMMKLFEDIAKAADPAFHKLSEDWAKFWEKLDTKYSTPEGFKSLENFFNKSVGYAESFAHLGKAIAELFVAIGHDAAPQGKSTVEGLTGSIKEATSWVKSHGPEVTKFFREAREGLELIGKMAMAIGLSLIKVFSVSSLTAFSSFINEAILPGLTDIINMLGKVVTLVIEFFNLFGTAGTKVLEVIGASGAIVYGVAKIVGLITALKKAWEAFVLLVEGTSWLEILSNPLVAALAVVGLAIAAVVTAFSQGQHKNKISAEEVTQALENQANAIRAVKNLSAEYKSSELGVKESQTAAREAQQSLKRTEREKVVPGEGETSAEATEAHKLRVERGREEVSRTKLSQEEAEKNFRELPEVQKQSALKSRTEIEKGTQAQEQALRQKIQQNEKNIKERNEVLEGSYSSSEKRETKIAIVREENEIAKAKTELAKTAQEGSVKVVTANSEINRSNKELAQQASKVSDAYGEAYGKFEESVGKAGGTVRDGMSKISDYVNSALKKYGVSSAEISSTKRSSTVITHNKAGGAVEQPTYTPRYAGGGFVGIPGQRGHDEVPALLGRGEAVLNGPQQHLVSRRMAQGGYLGGLHEVFRDSSGMKHFASGGFVADPGTNFTVGQEPKLVTALSALANFLHTTIYGISGYRSPQHSVEVGGFANDPHTRGEAVDIGVGSNSRESASSLTASVLAKFGLYRPFYPASAAEINHIQLLPADAARIKGSIVGSSIPGSAGGASTSEAIQKITAPLVKGGGAIGKVAQNAMDIVTDAANKYLEKQHPATSSASASVPGTIGSSWSGSWVQVMEQIAKAKHWSLAAWKSVIQRESGGDPNALGVPTIAGSMAKGLSRAYGLGQFLGSTYTEYSKYGADSSNPVKQIEAMAQYIANDYGTPTGALHSEETRGWYAGGGLIGRSAIRQLRKKILRFASGGRAPWGGSPVPIIAHEGERIMNPNQYRETARLGGMSEHSLDNHLGFNSSSPRQSFASGGKLKIGGYTEQKRTKGIMPPSAITTPPITSLEDISEEELGSIPLMGKILTEIQKALKKLSNSASNKKYKQYLTAFEKFVNNIDIEQNGVLARLKEGREAVKQKKEVGAISDELSAAPRGGQVQLRSGGLVALARSREGALREEAKEIEGSQNIANIAVNRIKHEMANAHSIKDKSSRNKALKSLTDNYNKLAKTQRELATEMSQNIEARYNIEAERVNNELSQLNSSYQTAAQSLSNAQSSAQSLGRFSEASGIDAQIKSAAESQIQSLEPILKNAEGIGDTELANSIKQEISGLRQTVTNAVVEQITVAQSLIQQEASTSQSKSAMLQSLSKVAAARGNYSEAGSLEKQALETTQSSLISQRASDEQLLAQASGAGDTGAVATLTQELNKNSAELAENNLALQENAVATRELTINQIEQQGQFKKGIYGSLSQGIELLGKTTGFTNVKALLGAAEGEKGVLSNERSGLEKEASGIGLPVQGMNAQELLTWFASPTGQQTIMQLESTMDVKEKEQMYKLVSSLDSNAVATEQNTEKIAELNGHLNQPQSWSTQAFQQFRASIFNGMGGLLPSAEASLPVGSRPENMPVYGSANPGTSSPTIGTVNLTHPVEKLDPQLMGEELSYHISTAQG